MEAPALWTLKYILVDGEDLGMIPDSVRSVINSSTSCRWKFSACQRDNLNLVK